MEYWHSACQSPVCLTDSDRGRCSPILSSSGNISQENGLNDWQLAPSVTAEVVLGSRGFYGRRGSELHLTKDGKHDDDDDSIVNSSEENVASFASRFVALGACTKSQLLCSYWEEPAAASSSLTWRDSLSICNFGASILAWDLRSASCFPNSHSKGWQALQSASAAAAKLNTTTATAV